MELSPKGEDKVGDGTLASSLRRDLGVDEEHGVFIPAVAYQKGSRTIIVHLLEGYVFVASGLSDVAYFRLEQRPYVQQVMSSTSGGHNLRTLSVIPDSQINEMRAQLHELIVTDIAPGSWVHVTEGRFQDLDGKVMGVEDDHAHICVYLRSMEFIATIPTSFLEVTEMPDLPERSRLNSLRAEMPRPSTFRDTVVSVLGMLSAYTPHRFFDFRDVTAIVLRQMGVPLDFPPYGWRVHGRKSLSRQVFYGFRNQREGYTKVPLTLEGGVRGQWGLTPEGVVEALRLNQAPAPAQFQGHVLVALGQLTGWKARSCVPSGQVVQHVLLSAGVNPEEPQRGWPRAGRQGLDRRIFYAFRNQREGFCTPPLTLRGTERGQWGLTPEGVLEARTLLKAGGVPPLLPRVV